MEDENVAEIEGEIEGFFEYFTENLQLFEQFLFLFGVINMINDTLFFRSDDIKNEKHC